MHCAFYLHCILGAPLLKAICRRNMVDPIKPQPRQNFLDEVRSVALLVMISAIFQLEQETRKSVWQPLAIDPNRPDYGIDPLAEFMPYDESDVVPLHEGRPTWPKRDRLHTLAECT